MLKLTRPARYLALALLVIGIAAVPLLLTGSDARYVLKVLTFVGINVMIVTGLALLHGYAGQISLGHAAFFGIGAYSSAYVMTRLEWPWIAGLLVAAALSAGGGVLLALPSLRLKGHYLAMATLGFGEIMRIAFVEAQGITGGPDGLSGVPYASVGGFEFSTPQLNYWLVWGTVAIVMWISSNIVRGRPGRSMLAVQGSELGAMASGVGVTGLKVRVFTISAAFAGIAGALYASVVGFISPSSFSLHFSTILVAMAVLGGTRSLFGPALAAALLTLVPYADAVLPGLSREALSFIQDWEADLYGLTIILVLLLAPGGVAALIRRVAGKRGDRP
ncbi:MAG: branched-chain amino acid ABC transporter permease [Actinobacteria bacterium HGW-Actinobacteria-10]|nr:MAG: branched-chain amino acid ABC transporter permease [Actinobacteria bacterium HGW-Actinobacteria-10]